MSSPLAALGNRAPEQLRVPELREELRKRGIQFKGLKKDLVDRLEEVLRQEEAEQIALAEKNETAVDDASRPSGAADDGAPDPVTPPAVKGTKGDERDSDAGPKENVAPEPENVVMAEDTPKETSGKVEDLPAHGQEKEVVLADVPSTVASVESEAEVTDLNIEVATTVTVVEETMIAQPAAAVDHSGATLQVVQSAPETEFSTVLEEQSVSESVVVLTSSVDNEDIVKPVVVPEEELGDLNVVQEKPVEAEVVTAVEVGGGVDEPAVPMNVEEEIVTTIVEEETVTTTVVIEQVVTTSTDEQTVTTNVVEQYVRATSEEEHSIVSIDDKETVKEIEDKTDDVMEEAAEEDDRTANDGAQEDLEAKTEADKPMEIDASSHKDSKRKDIADGETRTQEPTKRRRWNTGVGETDGKAPAKIATIEAGTEVPSEPKEELPSSNPPVSAPPTSTTPKVAPAPEKVAITRATPSRTEGVVNGEIQKARVVPPSAKPATTSLKIDRFLRPFTFKAVKVLLAQTGTVEDVWMDQIKTHCFVTYSSVEEAIATRNALYNVQWPPQGGRLLTAEFVEPSEVKSRCDAEKAAVAAAAATPATVSTTNAITPRGVLPAKTKTPMDSGAVATGPSSSDSAAPASATLPPPPPLPFPPRERPKQELEKTPTLDDLFKKTRAKPQIYYLPLTSQQVAEKLANRNQAPLTKPGVKA